MQICLKLSSRWSVLRRLCCGILVLLVVLMGSSPTQQVQAQDAVARALMIVNFGGFTPPIEPGVICKDQAYVIMADPSIVAKDFGIVKGFNDYKALVHVTGAQLGTIVPNPYHLMPTSGPARFTYRATQTGSETLRFTAEMPGRGVIFQFNDKEFLIKSADETFSFEVKDCTYKVKFTYEWQTNLSGVFFRVFGFSVETKLTRKTQDGPFEGTLDFNVAEWTQAPECTIGISDFTAPINITATLEKATSQLQLAMKYGKGTVTDVIVCPDGGGQGQQVADTSAIGLSKARFPQSGGTKSFKTGTLGGKPGKLTVKVELETGE